MAGNLAGHREVWPGESYPLGATYDGAGTNFALFSEVAERVELCLFANDGAETRVPLREVDPAAVPGSRRNEGARQSGGREQGDMAGRQLPAGGDL